MNIEVLITNYLQQDLSSYPDLAAYHCIAVTLGQAGHMKDLFDVIDCMRAPPEKKFQLGPLQKWDPRLEPDLVIYNAVSILDHLFLTMTCLNFEILVFPFC